MHPTPYRQRNLVQVSALPGLENCYSLGLTVAIAILEVDLSNPGDGRYYLKTARDDQRSRDSSQEMDTSGYHVYRSSI